MNTHNKYTNSKQNMKSLTNQNPTNRYNKTEHMKGHTHVYSKDHKYSQTNTEETTIRNEINEWIKETDYEKQLILYESSKSIWNEQIKYILKELTKNHKNKLLSYMLKQNETLNHSSKIKNSKSYTLLNENIWYGKNNIAEPNDFELIIETFDILISNGNNFFEFSILSNESTNKAEISNLLTNPYNFYVSVMRKNRIFPSELQNELFKYISINMCLKTPELFINSLEEKNSNVLMMIKSKIDNYFTDEKIIERKLKLTESFLGALINKDNNIDEELRERLYDYFTKIYWNKEHFVNCLRLMFNKITETNSILFCDNIQFILSRNVEVMTYEIFKLIVSRESTGLIEKNIINRLLSNSTSTQRRIDLIKYFDSIDMNLVKNQFVSLIIDNHVEWINEIVQSQKLTNPDVLIDEFITNDYGCLMMILGIAYSKNYLKNKILHMITSIIDHSQVDLIKTFGIFLETSKIKINELSMNEHLLISKYIKKYYFTPTGNITTKKYIIEPILSNFAFNNQKQIIKIEQINNFLNFGTFLIAKPNVKKLSKNVPIIHTNKFACIYESDDESDDETNDETDDETDDKTDKLDEFDEIDSTKKVFDENEEFDEEFDDELDENCIDIPNDEIFNNINMFFKSNDVEIGFDDLKYFIERSEKSQKEIKNKDFAYALFYSLSGRNTREINLIKILIQKMVQMSGFEKLNEEFSNLNKNVKLIKMLELDNPKIYEIIDGLKNHCVF